MNGSWKQAAMFGFFSAIGAVVGGIAAGAVQGVINRALAKS